MNMIEQLQKLQAMREQGALTEEEFTQAKKRVIEEDARATSQQSGFAQSASRGTTAINNLQRSWHDRWIAGVCGGLAVQTGLPTWTWRILFILATLLHGFGILIYILMWIFVPLERPQSFATATPAPAASPAGNGDTAGTTSSTASSGKVTDVDPQ